MSQELETAELPKERIELTLTKGERTFYRYVWREWITDVLARINCPISQELNDQQFVQEVGRLVAADPSVRSSIAMSTVGTVEGLQAVRYVEDAELTALLAPTTIAIPPAFAVRFDAFYKKECNILSDDEITPTFLEPQNDGHALLLCDEIGRTQALRIATVPAGRSEIQIFELLDQPQFVYARTAVDLADIDTAVRAAFDTWGTTG
ncbi:Uncharacterised protein [Mycobacteroides abscessus subsp. abscessus]|uniref:hypothetical protein n=1 Tax=Mycobacteroides abscessus TaxID=36809 RepID=UPI0009298B16|nr:hypothetical protein [Mycobacteroides abscessus]SIH19585.1 Uncharacterised protein [Mycobacteroides abscessus subsp. abscessus]